MSVDFIGPFEHHAVVVNGRRVPHLTATPIDAERIALSLDGRIGIDVSVSESDTIVSFIAHCIAVGMGYSCFPDENSEPLPAMPMPRMVRAEFL